MRGRTIRLSLPRRMIIDLLHFAAAVPTVPVQRRMSLAPLVAARAKARQRAPWSAIFTKAYALTAGEFPVLRRAYVKLPWPHLYEYPVSIANIACERDYDGEPGVFPLQIANPAVIPLDALGAMVRHATTAPIEEVHDFRRYLRTARLPRPIRRLGWWLALNLGRQRANYFGTFAVSVYSAFGAESLHPLSPLTAVINYGMIDAAGEVTVRIMYDHRVMDGGTIARVLVRLEDVLNGAIVDELRATAAPDRPAVAPAPTAAMSAE